MKFEHKKSLGQNFLKDPNLLEALAADAQILPTDNVLEIGPGLGALTEKLSKHANKVLAIETDERLKEVLETKFDGTNVTLLFRDFMEVNFEEIEQVLGREYIVVANLPYYITTPILFRFFSEPNGAKKIAIMVQKEVGERMCAKPNSKDYGILSVACSYFGSPKIARIVGKGNFDPVPKVDSAFVVLSIEKEQNNKFLQFVRECFSMRRKTLVNNLKDKYSKEDILAAIENVSKKETSRAEEFSEKELESIFEFLAKNNKK